MASPTETTMARLKIAPQRGHAVALAEIMARQADLPDDVLLFLLQSRYCDSDKLADFAWSSFGMISGGPQRV
jgi:hypothetical protein